MNLFKRGFIYLALMLFVLISFNVESASAAEVVDYEEGVTNLNNTPENSAIIGDQLLKPEKGWKRYENTDPHFKYIGNWELWSQPNGYKQSGENGHLTSRDTIDKVTFKAKTTKIRFIGWGSKTDPAISEKTKITIDGIPYYFSNKVGDPNGAKLLFEKIGLDNIEHTIEIENDLGKFYILDAIDIDSDGSLVDETASNNSITLDKNALELLEGSQDKLIATVTPDTAKVIWSSSDESIATVDQKGNVTALHEGEAIITAKIEGTDITATSTVIVKKPNNDFSSAILSITLVNGVTKEYDVTNAVLNNYLNWFDSAQGTSTFKFSKTISPYKKVAEYIVHDKIASFEVREY
ncbi:Ig-like domain-containing protein [Lysinibacillus parviboronicapiens]|uniref:Ig-like domain-containing protein n=1 Tax=Lysinibacillus parviboronicapiens TaxID=436516 RepID=UPI000D3AB2C7|nr:Ig-like domain-containing protein [Lysinibacillus parviboronicapiens]